MDETIEWLRDRPYNDGQIQTHRVLSDQARSTQETPCDSRLNAAAWEDVLTAYLTAQPTMSLNWVARFYDEDEAVIPRYVTAVEDRAAVKRPPSRPATPTFGKCRVTICAGGSHSGCSSTKI